MKNGISENIQTTKLHILEKGNNMINRKILIFCFFLVFIKMFCFGQEENVFFEFYSQYRTVKSHDHSLLLGYSIKEPFITYGMKQFYYDNEVDIMRFNDRPPKTYIVEDLFKIINIENGGVDENTGGEIYFLTIEENIIGKVEDNKLIKESSSKKNTILVIKTSEKLYVVGDSSLNNFYICYKDWFTYCPNW